MKNVYSSAVNGKISRRRTEFASRLLRWSKKNSPYYPWRETSDPYKILVSEMLLRRTRASNVVPVYLRFVEKFPNIKSLSKGSIREIERLVNTLGIKSRSVKIKMVADKITDDYSGKVPVSEEDLLTVLGQGSRYTVNAVRCFAGHERVPIFDVNVKRVFERMFSVTFGKESHKNSKSWETVSLALPTKDVRRFNWTLLDIGKLVCIPNNPKCKECPLRSICDYGSKS